MALLDQNFQKQCKPNILSVERTNIIDGESSIELEFAESGLVREVFGKMEDLNLLYITQILPRTDKDSLEIFVFDHSEAHHRIFSGIKIFQ